MQAKKLDQLTFADYLKIERESDTKYEFHDGTIYAMAGGTLEHGLIGSNVLIELGIKLRADKSSCRPVNSEVKLHIAAHNKYLYPDAMIVCGDIEKSSEHAITNPSVIIEVLSKSTEGYDRGDKFFFYKQIPTLQEYILIDQYQAQIDIYTRKSDLWKITRTEGIHESIFIPSLNINLELKSIYQDVLE